MSKNFIDFEKEILKEFDQEKKDINKKFKQHALDFLEYVTSEPPRGTPFVTGYTSASWNISINTPRVSTVGTPQTGSGTTASMNRQLDSIANLNAIENVEDIRSIFINNGCDYIEDLDGGSSTQSVGGFVGLGKQYAESRE